MKTTRSMDTAAASTWSHAARWIAHNVLDADAYLAALNPMWGNPHRARVIAVASVSGGTEVLFKPSTRFELPERTRFVTVGVDVEGVRLRRDLLLVKQASARPETVRALLRPEPDGDTAALIVDQLLVGRVVELAPRAPKPRRAKRRAPVTPPALPGSAPSTFWEQYDTDVAAATGQTLLESAEAAGLTPTFGCRAGVCRRCSIPLLEGRVTDVRDGRVTEAGAHIQPCTVVAATQCRVDAP
ncbi:MAG: iron-sulfur cluster-binding domain-containing protein [Actinobacteria bacterium]|nr:iron-sulfur cluster-binding domain-containing protein [Actinomycetota bacterium]